VFAVHVHDAAVGLQDTVDHFHQCRLAGAIFPQKCVDFTVADLESHVIVGDDAGKGLGNAF